MGYYVQWFGAYCDPALAVIDLGHVNHLQLYNNDDII
jgi:hypothetical protein